MITASAVPGLIRTRSCRAPSASRREPQHAPGLGGEAAERRGVHLGPRAQDEPIENGLLP